MKTGIAGVHPQRLLQERAPACKSRPDGSHRRPERARDLAVRQTLYVGQYDDNPEGLGEGLDRPHEVLPEQPVQELLLGGTPPEQKRLMQLLEQREVGLFGE